ncbi:MAG: hypothetical protein NTX87_05780 [Planctomycetota bacterium]|nr:hypothetical protein [Planctomycetota bacterium]
MTKSADSRGAAVKGAFERLDEIASGGGAQARFWRVYGRYAAKKARGETLSLDDDLAFALAAYDAQRLPTEAVTYMVLSLIDWQDVQPRVQKAYGRDFYDRYEAIRQANGLQKDEDPPQGAALAELQALDAEFEQAEGRICAEALSLHAEKTGHPLLKEIAALGRSDSLALEKRREEGRQWLFGPPDPKLAACLRARGITGETREAT